MEALCSCPIARENLHFSAMSFQVVVERDKVSPEPSFLTNVFCVQFLGIFTDAQEGIYLSVFRILSSTLSKRINYFLGEKQKRKN